MKPITTIAAVITIGVFALAKSAFALPGGDTSLNSVPNLAPSETQKSLLDTLHISPSPAATATTQVTIAQTNVQNAQVVGPTPSPSNLQPLSAVSTPSDGVVPSAPASGSTLSSLIALPPQNSSSPANSTNAATTVPAVSASPFVPVPLGPAHKFVPNLNVGESIVNITHPVASPAASTSPATANVPIQGSQVNEASHGTGTGTATMTATTNVPIQGSQTNQPATGLTTNTAAKNITIQNSQANNNNPAAVTLPNKRKTANADNRGFNRHPKIKHNEGEQEGDGQGQHHQQKMRSADQQTQPQGDRRGKGKLKPAATPD